MPNIYNPGVDRISNQRIKRALESDLAKYAVKKLRTKIFTTDKMPRGISNFQIEDVIKTINDKNLSNNFAGRQND